MPIVHEYIDPWRLRIARVIRGISINDIQKKKISISDTERYRKGHDAPTLLRLAKVLDVSIHDLRSESLEWRQNKAHYEAWCAAGCPDLLQWLADHPYAMPKARS